MKMKTIDPFKEQQAHDIMRRNVKVEHGAVVPVNGSFFRVIQRDDGGYTVHCAARGIHANYFDASRITGQGANKHRNLILQAVSLASKQLTADR
jgi:hypothetical protein